MSQFADPPLPYDEAYDEDGEPRPHYAALLVALERGSMVVNSGQGGGAKDTWVPDRRY